MRRRQVLAAVGLASLAGCSGLPVTGNQRTTPAETNASSTGTPTESTTAADTSTTTEQPPHESEERESRRWNVIDLETVPRTYALGPTWYRLRAGGFVTAQFSATATADHPATVSATIENTNDYGHTFHTKWLPPFGRLSSDLPRQFGRDRTYEESADRESLVLAPTANHDLVDDPPEVERDAEGNWVHASRVGDALPERLRLEAGETIHGEYYVVGQRESRGEGVTPGVYEFFGTDDARLRIAVWNTDRPGPDDGSRFAGTSVPTLSTQVTTAWYHEADATTTTYVAPSRERAALPAQVSFTFVNKSRRATKCGHWDLYKLVDGQWFHVTPWLQTAECRVLRPGSAKTWTLNAYPGEALPCIGYCGEAGRTVGYLGGGRYAAVVGYGHDTGRSAALVDLTGDPVTVVPTDDVEATRSGATTTVTSPKYEDDSHPPSATLTLAETDDADERIVPEQVMRPRYRGLRNTLAYVSESVDTVVLETDERVAERVVGHDEETRRFVFEGRGYEATIGREAE